MTDNHRYQCTKKVEAKGVKSSPEARGARLKKLRNMANLTRQKMCLDCGFNMSTYKGWEIARHGGLPLDGAKTIIVRTTKAGITCTLEWLLYGEGSEPFILPKMSKNSDTITKEISLFKLISSDAVSAEIIDDEMQPFFQKGDFVAGIKKDLSFAINHHCIVQLKSGEILVRTVKKGSKKNHYTLVCANSKKHLHDQELVFAAPVVRHYK